MPQLSTALNVPNDINTVAPENERLKLTTGTESFYCNWRETEREGGGGRRERVGTGGKIRTYILYMYIQCTKVGYQSDK